ncbi:capsular exopolysaccharide family [Actinomyces ruminicola]|uniref:Capsular exopolysaccharide family n=1 Tax=Actinomyces ruminicola TaxID=332524 RepID=A0A1G9ZDR0_9ACTO|nr:polysaccharide biosynthesis tyrosine autokinase [Actinomyces ruminicola]SDN19580.1 capsular exopolysaccharide family [Actinomyces ruminicola]
MTLNGLLILTRQRIGGLVLVTVFCVMAALSVVAALPVTYTARAVGYMRVSVPDDVEQTTDSYYMATQLASRKIDAVISVFTSDIVGQRVVDSLGLDETASQIAGSLTATHAENTATVVVTATASSPAMARRVADEAILQSAQEVRELDGERYPAELVLMSSSELSGASRSPSGIRIVGLGAVGGVVLGYIWIILREVTDKTLRGVDDVRAVGDAVALGVVPYSKSIGRSGQVRAAIPAVEEAMRRLRTNVIQGIGSSGSLIVTSPGAAEGRTTVAARLARVLALAGERVVLIEGDLRAPELSEAYGLDPDARGLSQLLAGDASLEEVMTATSITGLDFIPAGRVVPNPSELVASSRLAALISDLETDRIVIVDSPPVLPFADAVVMAERVGGVLLVARAGRTTVDDLQEAMLAVEQGGGTVAGVILNRTSSRWRRRPFGAVLSDMRGDD